MTIEIKSAEDLTAYLVRFRRVCPLLQNRAKPWWYIMSSINLTQEMQIGLKRCEQAMGVTFAPESLATLYALYCLEKITLSKSLKEFEEILGIAKTWQKTLQAFGLQSHQASNASFHNFGAYINQQNKTLKQTFSKEVLRSLRNVCMHEDALEMLYEYCYLRTKLAQRKTLFLEQLEPFYEKPSAWQMALMTEHCWHTELFQRQVVEEIDGTPAKIAFLDKAQTEFLVPEGLRLFEDNHPGFEMAAGFAMSDVLQCNPTELCAILMVNQIFQGVKVSPNTSIWSEIYHLIHRTLEKNSESSLETIVDACMLAVYQGITDHQLQRYGLKVSSLTPYSRCFQNSFITFHVCRAIWDDILSSPTKLSPTQSMVRVQIITDSVGGAYLVPDAAKDKRASNQLQVKFKGRCTFNNVAIVGNQIDMAAARTAKNNPASPLQVPSDIGLIPLGGNDLFLDRPLEEEESEKDKGIRKDVNTVIQNFADAGAQYLLWIVGVPPTFISQHGKSPEYLRDYAKMMDAIAKKHNDNPKNRMQVVIAHIPEVFFSQLADQEAEELKQLKEHHTLEKQALGETASIEEQYALDEQHEQEMENKRFFKSDGLHLGEQPQRPLAEFLTQRLEPLVKSVEKNRNKLQANTAASQYRPLPQYQLHQKSFEEAKERSEAHYIQTLPLPQPGASVSSSSSSLRQQT